jgi:transposase
MYIETVKNRNSPPCILLRESYREEGKVKKRTLANLTNWPAGIIHGLERVIKNGGSEAGQDFDIVRSLPHGHAAAVLGMARKLGIEKMLCSSPCRERDLLMAMIATRILSPGSKLGTARELDQTTATPSLGKLLELGNVDENDLYAAMDWLLQRQGQIERQLAGRHLQDGCLILYDLSASYVEGRCCPLAKLGHPRDGKKGKLQIEYGLLCDAAGRPVAVEVFPGNTSDPMTLGAQIAKIRGRFNLKSVVLVGDRGMLTEARIREEVRPVEGLEWISALRAGAIAKLIEEGHFAPSLFDERDMAEIQSPDFPGERLVVCRNPLLADERRRKREELLQATELELDKVAKAVARQTNPLQRQDKIGMKVGAVLNKYKMRKHFNIEIADNAFVFSRKDDEIAAESVLDGFYVIRTSVDGAQMTASQVVKNYKSLSRVERAFRCLKTVDLKIRPIFHYDADRVRAHVLLCMLAYYVEWHMREALAPILFQDDDKETAEARRLSPVAKAEVSTKAKMKAKNKLTEDGIPVHSFKTLLEHMATMTMNEVKPKIKDCPTILKITNPTPLQVRAFQLMEIHA